MRVIVFVSEENTYKRTAAKSSVLEKPKPRQTRTMKLFLVLLVIVLDVTLVSLLFVTEFERKKR